MLLWIVLVSLVLAIVAYIVYRTSWGWLDFWSITAAGFALICFASIIIAVILASNKPMEEDELATRKYMASIVVSHANIDEMSDEDILAVAKEVIDVNEAIKWYDKCQNNCFYEGIIDSLDDYSLIEVKDKELQRVIKIIESSTD